MVPMDVPDPFARCRDIARAAGVSRNTVTRWLKRATGETYRSIHAQGMMELVSSRQDGESVASFCRRTGLPRSTYYYWRAKARNSSRGEGG